MARKKPIPAILPENTNNTATSPAIVVDPTPGEINSTAAAAPSDAQVDDAITNAENIEQQMEAAQVAEVGPFEPEANAPAQLAMPMVSISAETQGDFPPELGTVEARADKPDGSSVVVTYEGRKMRRAAAGEPWIDTVLLAS